MSWPPGYTLKFGAFKQNTPFREIRQVGVVQVRAAKVKLDVGQLRETTRDPKRGKDVLCGRIARTLSGFL